MRRIIRVQYVHVLGVSIFRYLQTIIIHMMTKFIVHHHTTTPLRIDCSLCKSSVRHTWKQNLTWSLQHHFSWWEIFCSLAKNVSFRFMVNEFLAKIWVFCWKVMTDEKFCWGLLTVNIDSESSTKLRYGRVIDDSESSHWYHLTICCSYALFWSFRSVLFRKYERNFFLGPVSLTTYEVPYQIPTTKRPLFFLFATNCSFVNSIHQSHFRLPKLFAHK